jgi:hypothetical protein
MCQLSGTQIHGPTYCWQAPQPPLAVTNLDLYSGDTLDELSFAGRKNSFALDENDIRTARKLLTTLGGRTIFPSRLIFGCAHRPAFRGQLGDGMKAIS